MKISVSAKMCQDQAEAEVKTCSLQVEYSIVVLSSSHAQTMGKVLKLVGIHEHASKVCQDAGFRGQSLGVLTAVVV